MRAATSGVRFSGRKSARVCWSVKHHSVKLKGKMRPFEGQKLSFDAESHKCDGELIRQSV